MQQIKTKNIQMKSCYFFCARKIGLQSLLAFFVVASAVFLNVIWYFLKKNQSFDFLSFGWTGVNDFLIALPYDFIILFLVLILLADYLIHKFDLSCGISMNSAMALFFLLSITLLLSFFFFLGGIEDTLRFWMENSFA